MYNNYFQHKIVLVTGGGSGIGRGLCLQLAAEGATVFCTDIDLTKATETASMAVNDKVIDQKLDVTIETEFESIIAEIVNQYGQLDLIFNNAGIAVSGEIRDIAIAQWKKIIDINLYGVLNGSQIAYRQMLKQGSGQIVNIASAAGLIDHLGLMAPYSVTKHAVVNYTKILRLEAKKLGVKANVVCPGFIRTSIGTNAINPNANKQWNNYAIEQVAKGISVENAIDKILKGVASNREVIIFPYQVKIIYHFTQLFKGLYKIAMQKIVKDYREKYRLPDR